MNIFRQTNKKLLSKRARNFWKLANRGKISEEQATDLMEEILSERPMFTPDEIEKLTHWKLVIGVFFAVTKNAKRQQVDMFDALYRFSDPQTLLDGNHLRLMISKGMFSRIE